jgi:endoglucanase
MLAMQDPADGGVYHKLTNKRFDGVVMPADATGERYVVQKSTAAALDFAAVMAQASRVFAAFDKRSGRGCLRACWPLPSVPGAGRSPTRPVYKQPADIRTGGYGDAELDDEFAWAAAELYVTTRDARYRPTWPAKLLGVPGWGDVEGLGLGNPSPAPHAA